MEFYSLSSAATQNCPLCSTPCTIPLGNTLALAQYYQCRECALRFVHPEQRLAPAAEELRYRTHNNNLQDKAYQDFVAPLVEAVAARCLPGGRGLDFGSGTAPILSAGLAARGFLMREFDCFFANETSVFDQTYDFIASSEVFEHLFHPGAELERLTACLRPGGVLGIMTLFYPEDPTQFESWYYRRDPTHVVFYHPQTLHWIAEEFGYSAPEILSDRVAVLTKSTTRA